MAKQKIQLTDYEQKVGTELNNYLQSTGLSLAELISRHSLNSGYVRAIAGFTKIESKIKGGTELYPKLSYYKKVARIIGIKENNFWHHIDTIQYKNVFAICEKAQSDKDLRLIDGQQGYGKTYSLESYWRTNNEVAYVKMMKKWNKKTFLQKIANSLNIRKADSYSISAIQDKIVDVLNSEDSNWLLILDEMEQASKSMWVGVIKDLIDDTQIGSHDRLCGFVICGSGINEKVKGWTHSRTAKQGANQLWDRLFGSWQLLEGLKEGKYALSDWKATIKIALDNTGVEMENEKDVIEWLSLLNTKRSLSKVVDRACQYATKNNKPISAEMLDMLYGKELSYGE
ncbi:ATP-binding protein [Bernardetia sp. ABR2-2B]|uniref:ATP-binding protein n=1 Tax=Bernardetia sp. ABR2-2B TaxID=3127472 RepID=UPI0030CE40D2